MEDVKNVIINRNLSPRSRGMLLFLIDLANQRYNPLSGEMQNFYVGQLGTSTFKSIQRYTDLLTVNTKIKNQIEGKKKISNSIIRIGNKFFFLQISRR